MTMRWKAVPWAVGVVLLAATLLGARLLDQTDASPKPGAPAKPSPAVGGGVTVLGSVVSDPPESAVGPPALAALLTVEKLLVAEGQTVAVGDPLVKFDDALIREKLPQARAGLAAARADLVKAEAQKAGHPLQLQGQELKIRTLRANLKEGEEEFRIGREQFERVLDLRLPGTGQIRTPAEKVTDRAENLDLRKANETLNNLRANIEGEELKLQGLKLTPIDADVAAANAKIAQFTATVAEAQNALDACTLKARVAGVVERIYATPGQTFGPASRAPVLWIVPAGKRVVRAEVESEFAPRVADKEGTKVSITDSNNFAVTYEGTVRRVGTAFLAKRSQQDALALAPTYVLECVIDVTDPAPPGKPPLRVGQPVRVSFP
jgi:multidrug resistance efflux pump